jgi:hypothetical protein
MGLRNVASTLNRRLRLFGALGIVAEIVDSAVPYLMSVGIF